jgi:hypothetical protein
VSTPSDDPIEVLITHAQSLGDAWLRYAALSQSLYPGQPVAEMARKRLAAETGEHIIGPDHWMFEIELAIIEDFRRAGAARRYLAAGRAAGSLTETPLPADLYQNARLRIVRGELLLYPPRPPRPIKIVRVSAVPTRTIRLSPEWDLMVDQRGNIAILSGDAAIEQDAECARRQTEDEASQVTAAVATIEARHRAAEVPEDRLMLRGRRRRKWRREWIVKFAERQRIARRWVAIVDLIDWCAHSTTTASIDAEAAARKLAYRRLTESMRRGEFEHDGRSKLLYLDTLVTSDGASPRCRLTREQLEIAPDIAAVPPAPSSPITVLNCCWLPADLARHWLRAHGYTLPPYLKPEAPQETGPSDPTLPMDESIQRVGRGLHGGDWIGALTKRERWLIERYIDGPRKDRGSAILPGAISYVVGGRQWAEVPGDPALLAEADRARDRRDWMEAQREAVFDWFETRGFDLDCDRINQARFETALAMPHKRGAAARQPPQQAEPVPSVDVKSTTHSGFPGRPVKAKHLIEDEFKRRTKSGEALLNLADEASALLDWLIEVHPTVSRPTKRTIENNIRDDHRRWRVIREADPTVKSTRTKSATK